MHSPVLQLPPFCYSTFCSSRILLIFPPPYCYAKLFSLIPLLSSPINSVILVTDVALSAEGANSFPCTCLLVGVLECTQRLAHTYMQKCSKLIPSSLGSQLNISDRSIRLFACELLLLLGLWNGWDAKIQLHHTEKHHLWLILTFQQSSLIGLGTSKVMHFNSLSVWCKKKECTDIHRKPTLTVSCNQLQVHFMLIQ